MGAKYGAFGNQNLSSSSITALTLGSNASTAQRNYLAEYIVADEGTPADNVVLHTLQRCTALGTSTAVTSTLLDLADRAAQAAVGENHTAEPTYTANTEVAEFALNTRATFRWVAAPGFEIITPATVASGVGWSALHASATTAWGVQAYWSE